jgi:hypothetical protein
MTFDACALRKMSRSGAGCRKMWVAAPQLVTWVRQGHTTIFYLMTNRILSIFKKYFGDRALVERPTATHATVQLWHA